MAAYVLVLALIPVFKPWQRDAQWDFDDESAAGDDEHMYANMDIVSEVPR